MADLYTEHAVRGALAREGIVGEVADKIIAGLRAHRPRRAVHRSSPSTAALIDARGKRMTIRDWSRETGISEWTIRHRLRAGWAPHLAVTVKPQRGPITGATR